MQKHFAMLIFGSRLDATMKSAEKRLENSARIKL